MRHSVRRLSLVALAVAASIAWAQTSSATPEFPSVVVQTLGLPGVTIDAPQGCTLCHATDSGGTALRPFGLLVQQDGTQPYEDATLEGALAEIAQEEPAFIADIKAGRDPNDDDSVTTPPTPQYGCSLPWHRPPRGADAWWAIAATVGLIVWVRRLRQTN